MPLDHYVTLGRSGLKVSPLCLGAMTFGEDWGWGSDAETSAKILDTYIDRGGNFIDTANIYTKGHSEKIIGDHVGRHPARRDRLVIATKSTGSMFPGDPNAGGGGRKSLLAAVDESLRRLQTDYIDLLWAHFWDQNSPIDELMRTADDLQRAGKVRYFGLSDHPAWVCAQAQYEARLNHWSPVIAIQIEYSLRQRTVEGDLIPMARALGMGVTPWSPLAGGVLTGRYTRETRPDQGRATSGWINVTERDLEIIDVLTDTARRCGATPAQVALKWVQDRPGVTSTIIGARTLEQLQANLGALDIDLADEDRAALDEVSKQKQAFPHDFINNVKTSIQNGTRINGEWRDVWAMSPRNDDERH